MSKNKTDLTYQQETQTLIGEKERHLQDLETGEVFDVKQITKRVYGQKHFWKVYLMDFMSVLGILDSKQLDILIYIVSHTHPANNTFIGTYKQIAKDVNCSQPTIAKILKKLKEKDFIRSVQNGVYVVNPLILMKGDPNKQKILLNYYDTHDAVQTTKAGQKPISATSTGLTTTPTDNGQFTLMEKFENETKTN